MKSILLSIVTALAFAQLAQAADVTVKISNVHLCCGKCLNGVTNAVSGIDGVKATADRDTEVVEITGPDKAALQKAADALIKAGYFGESSDRRHQNRLVHGGQRRESAIIESRGRSSLLPQMCQGRQCGLEGCPGRDDEQRGKERQVLHRHRRFQ